MTNAERQKRYRERKRNESVTHATVGVTPGVTESVTCYPVMLGDKLRSLELLVEKLHTQRHLTMTGRRCLLDWLADPD